MKTIKLTLFFFFFTRKPYWYFYFKEELLEIDGHFSNSKY